MKISYALAALLAIMFCMAGIVSASTTTVTVTGTNSATITFSPAPASPPLNLVPGNTASGSVTIAGQANCAFTIVPTTAGLSLNGKAVTFLASPLSVTPNPATISPAPMDGWSKTFSLSQPVAFSDPVGSYSGTITFTATAI